MNRLRARLMISHLVVLLVTLAVISLLLILVLLSRPVPTQTIYQQLTTVSQVVNRTFSDGLGVNLRTERVITLMNRLAESQGIRVLSVDARQTVHYDSSAYFPEGAHINLREEPQPPPQNQVPVGGPQAQPPGPGQEPNPPEPRPAQNTITTLVRGNFWQEGQEWLFVGQPAPPQLGDAFLIVSRPRPQTTWNEVFRFFNDWVFVPLIPAAIAGLVIASGLAWLVSRGVIRPLHRLGKAAQSIAAGDYHERVPVQGPDEMRDVAVAFNDMAEQVHATQEAQQDFLANVSHDLRTPLTSIQGFSQAIMDGASQDPAHHARIIYDEAGRLNRMVGELLDLARVSAGRLGIRQGSVDLAGLTMHITEGLALKAAEKGAHFVRDIQPVPDLTGDGDRLAQVLTNLVENAIKFTPPGGTVRISLDTVNNGVGLTVSDTGQGIPADELPRIFERFYQVDKARGPRRGTGLGLAITAEIVRAHGGTIRADSGGQGRGTTFTVWLPAMGMSTIVRRV